MASFTTPTTTLRTIFTRSSSIQQRLTHSWTPPAKYKDVTRLDKFHRTEKKLAKADKIASIARAETLHAQLLSSPSANTAHTLPFHIGRTGTQNFAVYEQMKNGGNRQITLIRKLKGDLEAVKSELVKVLGFEGATNVNRHGTREVFVTINQRTGHVIVKGHRGAEIIRWASALGF